MAMDAGEVSVQITGQQDGLDQALDDSASKVENWSSNLNDAAGKVDDFNSSLTGSGEAASGWGSKLNEVFSAVKGSGEGLSTWVEGFAGGVLGGILVDAAEKAIEKIGELGKAIYELGSNEAEFSEKNKIFAEELGISGQKAAELQLALASVNVSSDQYAQMGLKMEQRVRTQEESLNALGIKTRDAAGNLLDLKSQMDAAISTMDQYRAGADRDQVALAAFGRGAKEVYEIAKANDEVQQQATQHLQEWGYSQDAADKASEDFLKTIRDLWDDVKGFSMTIGEELLPSIKDWAADIEGPLHAALVGLGVILKVIIGLIDTIIGAFSIMLNSLGGAIGYMSNSATGLGNALNDAIHGNGAAALNDLAVGGQKARDSLVGGFNASIDRANALATELDALNGVMQKDASKSDAGTKTFIDPKKVQEAVTQGEKAVADFQKTWDKMTQESIKSEEQTSLARVKLEQDANNHLLAMHQETIQQHMAKDKQYATDEYNIKMKSLQDEANLNSNKVEEHQKSLDQIKKLEADHQVEMQRIADKGAEEQMKADEKAAKHHASSAKGAAKAAEAARHEETQSYILELDNQLAAGLHKIDQEYNAHQISETQKVQMEKDLTAKIKGEELKRLDDELATLQQGTAEWNKVYAERLRIAQEMYKKLDATVKQSAKDEQGTWANMAKQDYQVFTQSLNGMILGTTSWKQALGNIIDGVATNFLNMVEKNIENWLFGETTKAAISKTTDGTSAVSQITSAAGVAGANTFASTSAIPIVGPELAPAAASAAVSSTMAFSSLAFAEKGMVLDRDRLVFAHKDEQILPADLSKGMMDMIRGGNKNVKHGDTHLNYSPQINAPQQKSLGSMLKDEASTMRAWLKAQQRDGYLKGA